MAGLGDLCRKTHKLALLISNSIAVFSNLPSNIFPFTVQHLAYFLSMLRANYGY